MGDKAEKRALPPIRFRTLIVSLAAVVGVEVLASLMGRLPPFQGMLLLGGVRLVQIALVLGVLFAFNQGWASLGLGRGRWLRGLWRGCLWSLGFALVTAAGALVLHLLGVNFFRMVRVALPWQDPPMAAAFLVVGGLVGPAAEELVFRGLAYGCFRRWGVIIAVVVTTAVFAGLHYTGGQIPVIQAIGGVLFCLCYEKEKNLIAPLVVHSAGNLALFTLSSPWARTLMG